MNFQAARSKFDEIKQLKSNLVLQNTEVGISILFLYTHFIPFQIGNHTVGDIQSFPWSAYECV